MNWLEVGLELDGELAEPVSDLLHRYCQGGVVIEAAGKPGRVFVRGYLSVDGDTEIQRHKIEEGLWFLGRIRPLPEPTLRAIDDQDWAEAWKQHYHPIEIGRRLLVLPAWIKNPNPKRIPLLMDPGMAFGTGTHPTTQLCLQALESHLNAGDRVLDLGTGSGILAIAAAKLGAGFVFGLDTDPIAVSAASKNVSQNQVAEIVHIQRGSLDVCPRQPEFDLIVANILTGILLKLLDQGLAEYVTPNAKLVLSGILDHQSDQVVEAYLQHELELLEVLEQEDWRAIVLHRK